MQPSHKLIPVEPGLAGSSQADTRSLALRTEPYTTHAAGSTPRGYNAPRRVAFSRYSGLGAPAALVSRVKSRGKRGKSLPMVGTVSQSERPGMLDGSVEQRDIHA